MRIPLGTMHPHADLLGLAVLREKGGSMRGTSLRTLIAIVVRFAFGLSALNANAASVTVNVKSGALAGDSLVGGGGVFKGIPYATSPTGTRRWQSPQSVAAIAAIASAVFPWVTS